MSWFSDIAKAIEQVLGSFVEKESTGSPQNPYSAGRPLRRKPPKARGEYRWRSRETGDIDYIGISSDLDRRRREHEHSGHFSTETHSFEWMDAKADCDYQDLRDHERKSIRKHKPSKNVRKGGGGRSPRNDG